ncbi:hypothetical protein GTCCBUS3UF5_17560 [Geobacillus thermoleovorans CCB_US3_UF5]|uniref:Uncharacterized protein n=4 Tax=Geobacillus thermoleovorans group TaxID=1505648 RepID=Q5KZS7_GEOKA|nr:hypothetical protein GTCCBUS3UF5_17560 [Geobacillus thermoleovorans CCB_US3_UF5]AUI38200.1 hypothetical protein CWI35_02530 [[Bacillus] caldolyticus]AWO76551.1 hypothetical protein C1N76_18150 [Geobacillus thermoleovorans]OQP17206.1 hypothetical protein B1694_18520 [Geobacillus zalihae]QCK82788.1 hypothetical protein E5Z46_11440 [Geobacillus kaustophilus NBRC 102445]TRY43531.1 hypothetical protein FOI67_07485 [Geobacillus sp. LEMMJ02]BAD75809.1 hypothetical protein GK1524 [Geobacillus kaus
MGDELLCRRCQKSHLAFHHLFFIIRGNIGLEQGKNRNRSGQTNVLLRKTIKKPGAAGGTDCLNEKRKIIYNE